MAVTMAVANTVAVQLEGADLHSHHISLSSSSEYAFFRGILAKDFC